MVPAHEAVPSRRAERRARCTDLRAVAEGRGQVVAHCGGAACQPPEDWRPCACLCSACFRVIDIHRRAGIGASLDDWLPNPGPQMTFLQTSAFEALYGGSKGGGKSSGLVAMATRLIGFGSYRGLLLRREYPQLVRNILPATKRWYPHLGGRWYAGEKKTWVFPSGAVIELGSADKASDVEKYQGTEYQFIGLDELTLFEESQYLYLISLLRSSENLPLRMRSTSNPGSKGHAFVLKRFAPWLYPATGPGADQYHGPRAVPGQVLYFRRDEESDEDLVCDRNAPSALSRSFVPSTVKDTPQLRGTKYEANLNALSRVERKRYRDGDWLVQDAAGEFFERGWFLGPDEKLYDACPAQVLDRLRYWDLASTPANKTTPSSAWTAGVRMSVIADGLFWIEDIVRGQWSPGDVRRTILATAASDPAGTRVIIERDPGQAGADQANEFAKMLAEYAVQAIPPQGDKLTRARPPSAQAEAGNIRICKLAGSRPWQEPFFGEAEQFPAGTKDQIDGLSGGYRLLARVLALHQARTAPSNQTSRREPPAAQRRGGFA